MPTTTIDTRMTSRMSMFGTLLESSYFVSPTPLAATNRSGWALLL